MDSNPSDSAKPPPSLTDPNLINILVEEVKSKGIYDQIRSDALAEVDTKPAYQNLRQRVETSASRYLNGLEWKPTSNKAQLRNMLRKHLQDSVFLETGVHNIVDQVVGPKIQQINPEVENILCTMFGMEKQVSDDEEEEMMLEDTTAKSKEKLSNISSDIDVEMADATDEQPLQQVELIVVKEHEGENMTDASSPGGPGLRGDISPLTPEKATSPEGPRGDLSPLTPPPTMDIPEQPPPPGTERTPSPRTPPGPPPCPQSHTFFEQEVVEEEIITQEENVSPVSEGEFGDISPPKGSPDMSDDSGMPSDISDAELPVSQSEKESSDDLEGIEEARAELLAKLASAGISDEVSEETSEGKITSDNNKSQKSEAEESDNNKSQKSEAEKEEKAEKTEEEKKDIETDDHEQAKREMDKDNSQIPKDPDDSNGAPGVGGNPSSSASTQVKNPSSTDSSNFEKDNKMPRTKTYKRKFSTTTNGSDVKKKSKPKLFIPEVLPVFPPTAQLIPIPETLDKNWKDLLLHTANSESDTVEGSSESDTYGKNSGSDDKEAQSSESDTKEKKSENYSKDESSERDTDDENFERDDEDENFESDDEDESSESDTEDNNNCGKCVKKTIKIQRLKLLNERAKLKLESLEESYYSMRINEQNGWEGKGSENCVECFELKSKIPALEMANDEAKTRLKTLSMFYASAKKALEKSKAEATVELQKVENQLQTEVASKISLEESLAKYQKLKQLLATKIFQSNPSNEDLIALLNLEIEKLFEKYDQIVRFNKSDTVKVKEEIDLTMKDKKLDLQILQRELYEKELDGIMDVLKMPSGDRNYTNILPMIKDLLQQVDTDHCTNAVENLINMNE